MSRAKVEFTSEALREIDEAFERFEAGTRRYVLRKFPYNIFYREIPVGIEVVAVAHHKRRPRYWIRRLRRNLP